MNYEYYTFPGNGETLVQVYNAIAMICGNADFEGLMRLGALLGFVISLVVWLYKLDLRASFLYIFVVAGLWLGLMVPKSTVFIIESSGHNASSTAYKVDNVPFGLAVAGHTVSKVGSWMTKKMEQVMSLPDDMQYSETGVLFGNKFLRQMNSSTLSNSALKEDWTRFMSNCAFYDMNVYKFYEIGDLLDSPNLITTLGNTNQVLFTAVTNGSNEKETMRCSVAYNNLYTRTQADVNNQVIPQNAKEMLGYLGWQESNVGPTINDVYMSMGDSVVQYMTKSVSTQALDSITQGAMINMIRNAEIKNAIAMDNRQQLSVALASAQAEQQYVNAQLTGFSQASSFLPILRATLEAILIGLFPLMMFISFLAGGMALQSLGNYVMNLFWLQLWGPVAAILNLILTSYSANNIYSNLHGYAQTTLSSSNPILKAAVDGQAVAGYCLWLVPIISYGIVMLGKNAASGLLGAMAPAQSASNAAGSATGAGNFNAANASYNNAHANNQDTSMVYRDGSMVNVANSTGSYSWNTGQEGSMRASATRHDLPISSQASIRTSDTYSQKAAQSMQAAQSQEAMASASTTLGNAYSLAYAVTQGTSSSAGKEMSSQLSASEQRSINEMAKASESLSEKWGTTHSSIAASALTLGLALNKGSSKTGSSGTSVGSSNSQSQESTRKSLSSFIGEQIQKTAGLSGSIGSQGSVRNQDVMARDVMDQLTALQEKGVSYTDNMAKSISESNSFRQAVQSGNNLAQSAQASYSAAQSATLSARQSYSEAQNYEQMAQKAAESNASITLDTSHATGQSYLGSGGNLGQMYQQPGQFTEAIQASGQSALSGKQALEQATTGSDYNPDRNLKSSDMPTNTVGQTHQSNVSNLNQGVAGSFSKIEQTAQAGGVSGSQSKIAAQKSGLESEMSTQKSEFAQHHEQVSGAVGQDHKNIKQSYQDAVDATSPFQSLNSAKILPNARSEGNNGNAVDMAKDIGGEVVKRSEMQIPGSSTSSEGFTQKQQDIQQENKEASKVSNLFGNKGSGSVTLMNFVPPKKEEDKSDPKP